MFFFDSSSSCRCIQQKTNCNETPASKTNNRAGDVTLYTTSSIFRWVWGVGGRGKRLQHQLKLLTPIYKAMKWRICGYKTSIKSSLKTGTHTQHFLHCPYDTRGCGCKYCMCATVLLDLQQNCKNRKGKCSATWGSYLKKNLSSYHIPLLPKICSLLSIFQDQTY